MTRGKISESVKGKKTKYYYMGFVYKANYTFCHGTIIRAFALVRMIVP